MGFDVALCRSSIWHSYGHGIEYSTLLIRGKLVWNLLLGGGKGEGVEGVLNTFRDGREGDELVPFLFPSSYVFIKIRNTHLVKRSISETCRILG